MNVIRANLATLPGWLLLLLLGSAALGALSLATCAAFLAFVVRAERLDVRVQREAVDAELAAMTSPQDAPEGADGRELT